MSTTAFLIDDYGIGLDNMIILSGTAEDDKRLPTTGNILKAMPWLVRGARTNDILFFHTQIWSLSEYCDAGR